MRFEVDFCAVNPTGNFLLYNECFFTINLLRKTQNSLQMTSFLVNFSVSTVFTKSEIFFKSPTSCKIYFLGHYSIISIVNIKYILKIYASKLTIIRNIQIMIFLNL